jgi:di/tricarboxylate transporter
MGADLVFVLVVLGVAVLLFVTEWLPPAVVSMLVLAALLLAGIVPPEEGLAGFSNEATVAVTAMFVLSASLEKSGVVDVVGDYLGQGLKRNYLLSWLALLTVSAIFSGFINNTAVVAILIPILLASSDDAGVSPTRLLLPVSFASMFGGLTTLVGTSTNLVVSSIVEEHGEPALGMFEFTGMGACFLGVGLVYMWLVRRWLPERREAQQQLTSSFELRDYLTELQLADSAHAVGLRLDESLCAGGLDIDVLAITRSGDVFEQPGDDFVLESGDVVRIRGKLEALERLLEAQGFSVTWAKLPDEEMETEEALLVEAIVTPESELDGATLDEIDFRERFDAIPLAIRKPREIRRSDLGKIELHGGDMVLFRARPTAANQLEAADELMVVRGRTIEPQRPRRLWLSLAIIASVILLTAFEVLPIAVSAVAGCVALVVTRTLTFEEAMAAVHWNVVFLLAGVLALGVALEKTGGDRLLSDGLLWMTSAFGPIGAVSGLYLAGALLTSAMSNNATAALLTPIALATAGTLGVDSRPLVMAIAYSASASFLTPVGYQTNTMVYGAGHYRFRDFVFVGGPLTVIFWILATFLIPVFWPLN